MDSVIDLNNDTVCSIDDYAVVYYRQLSADELEQQVAIADPFNMPHNASFIQALLQLNHESNQAIEEVSALNAELASYLNVLDIKINLIAERLLIPSAQHEQAPQKVLLSQHGLGFGTQHLLSAGAMLSIKFILQPSYQVLTLLAQVISSQHSKQVNPSAKDSSQTCWTYVNFTNITTIQEQWIAKHILNKQAQELKKTRQL